VEKKFFCPTLYSQAEANPKRSIFFTHFNEVDPSIQKGSISPKCLPKLIRGQFHQHFICAFFQNPFAKKLPSQNVTEKSCAKQFCMKNRHVKC